MTDHHSSLPAIAEVRRLASPAPLPQALATPPGGACLYMAPRGVPLLYAIDVATLIVTAEIPLPSAAWGATFANRVITYVASDGPDDDRVVRSYDLATDRHSDRFSCPEDTGSYVTAGTGTAGAGAAGKILRVTQFYKRRILDLGATGDIEGEMTVPHDICGIADGPQATYLITTDDEESDEYFLTRVDLAAKTSVDVARIPFKARSLAWDGTHFWTNHRERHEIVSFEPVSAAS